MGLARAGLLVLGWAMTAFAQQPITFEQVLALPAPPPTRTISYGLAPQQFGHLRLPKHPGPYPAVIFVHGGCYLSEYSIAHAGALEQALADAGYAVWSLEYRRVGDPGGGWPGTFQDVAHGADHLRALAKKYPLDLKRVVAMGHSAGGNFALWLAARGRIAKDSPLRVENPLAIAGVLSLTPMGDLAEAHAAGACSGVMDQLMGGSPASVADRYRAASPGHLLPIGVPQAIVIAGKDVAFGALGRSYYTRAVAAGDAKMKLVEAPASGHFDVIAPTTPAWRIVMQSLHDVFETVSAGQ